MRPKWLVECLLLLPLLVLTSPLNTTECVDQVEHCNEVQHLCDHPESGPTTQRACAQTCNLCADDLRCPAWFPSGNCTANSTDEKRVLCPRSSAACKQVELKPIMRASSPSRKRPRQEAGPSSLGPQSLSPNHVPAESSWGKAKKGRRTTRSRATHPIPVPRPASPPRRTSATEPQPKSRRFKTETIFQFLEKSMKKEAGKCTNFYKHVCGNYKSEHQTQLPPDIFGVQFDLHKRIKPHHMDYVMQTSLHTVDSKPTKSMLKYREICQKVESITNIHLSRDLYRTIKKFSSEFPMFNPAFEVPRFDFTKTLVKMAEATGVQFGYQLSVEEVARDRFELTLRPPDLLVSSLDFYNKERPQKKTALFNYVLKIVKMFARDNEVTELDHLHADIEAVIAIDREIAFASDGIKEDVLSPTTTFQLKQLLRSIKWKDYVKGNPLFPNVVNNFFNVDRTIFVESTTQLEDVDRVYNDKLPNHPRQLLNYLIVRFILQQVPYMDKRYVTTHHEFNHQVYKTPKPTREEHCYNRIMEHFGPLADYLYIDRVFKIVNPARSFFKPQVLDIQNVMQTMLEQQIWISAKAKKHAKRMVKATQMVYRIAEETKNKKNFEREYEGLSLLNGDSFAQMTTKLTTNRAQKVMKQLQGREHVLIRHWPTTDVKIGNMKSTNTLFIPSALLIEPFLQKNRLPHFNFGLFGSIVARELMHNLDDGGKVECKETTCTSRKFVVSGSLINELGAYEPWWDGETRNKFTDRVKKLYPEQKNKEALRNLIVDSAVIRVVYKACEQQVSSTQETEQQVLGFQNFFISYVALFCSSDPQVEVRVNEVLKNFDKFGEVFKCNLGTEMSPVSKESFWEWNPHVKQ